MNEQELDDVEDWSAALDDIKSLEFENPENVQIWAQKFPPAKIQIGDSGTAEQMIAVERADKLTVTFDD